MAGLKPQLEYIVQKNEASGSPFLHRCSAMSSTTTHAWFTDLPAKKMSRVIFLNFIIMSEYLPNLTMQHSELGKESVVIKKNVYIYIYIYYNIDYIESLWNFIDM